MTKKVLVFSPFPPTMSGASWATYNSFKRLEKKFKVIVINYNGFLLKKNLFAIPVSPAGDYSITRGPFFILLGFILGFIISKVLNIDLIYAKNLSTPSITAFLVSKATRKPLVIHTSGPDIQNLESLNPSNYQGSMDSFYRKIVNYFLKKELKSANAIIANCQADLDVLKKQGYGNKTKMIYNGVDFHIFHRNLAKRKSIRKEFNISANDKLVIFTGQPTWQKNLSRFRKIAKHFSETNFLIIGMNQSSRDQNLFIKAKVPPHELAGYLSASDLFLLTSYGEGLSNSLLEAIATENFPLSSSISDHERLFKLAGDGKICYSFKEFIENISVLLLQETSEIHNRAKKIHDYVVKHFSWDRSSQKMEKIFEHIISRRLRLSFG